MKAMTTELDMYKSQVTSLKNEIEGLNGNFKHQQEQYFKKMSSRKVTIRNEDDENYIYEDFESKIGEQGGEKTDGSGVPDGPAT